MRHIAQTRKPSESGMECIAGVEGSHDLTCGILRADVRSTISSDWTRIAPKRGLWKVTISPGVAAVGFRERSEQERVKVEKEFV